MKIRHLLSQGAWLGAALVGLNMSASLAHAAPSLVLLEDNGDTNPVYRQVIESLGAVIVANNLGHYYDHIDVLTGNLANREGLFAQIRKRGVKSDVDVVILTHGSNLSLALATGNITEKDIRAAGIFPRLRMVYMMGCYSASLESAWQDAGARIVVGHQDVNSLSGFFFPHFLKLWAQGLSAREAAEAAYAFSEGTASKLSRFVREDQDLLSGLGVTRSEPVLRGVDMDRFGNLFPEHSLAISPLSDPAAKASSNAGAVRYSHSDFERMGISLLGSMIPQATLNVDAIPSAQGLVDRIHSLAWDQLRDSFPPTGGGDPFPDLSGLPTEDGQEIWIDGEAVRYFLSAVKDYVGNKLAPVMEHVQGVRLTRSGDLLNAAIYFDTAFDISIQDEKKIPNWQPYAIHVPKTIRFSVRMLDGILVVSGLDQGQDALNLKLKMPLLPDSVWVRTATVNLSDGKVHVEAGVIGNLITVIANAEITTRKLDGIDIWGSIERNLSIWDLPTLNFHRL